MSCAKPSKNNKASGRGGRRIAVGFVRLALVAAAIFAVAPRGADSGASDPSRLLAVARDVLPAVVALGDESDGFHELLDSKGDARGWVTGTFPHAANIRGYNGPSELMVVLDSAAQVRAVRMLESSDTAGHVDKVLRDAEFWEQWTGRGEAELGDLGTPHVVSGATLTSEAMARGVAARFGAKGMDEWFVKTVEPDTVSRWFPEADRITADRTAGVSRVFSGDKELGVVLRSTRMGVGARGFNGVSDVIVALEGDVVKGVGLLDSRDNEPYVGDVKDELRFADGFAGRGIDDVLGSPERDGLVVSGASVTANAVTATVREMLRRHGAAERQSAFPWGSLAAVAWITIGLVLGLGRANAAGDKERGRFVRWVQGTFCPPADRMSAAHSRQNDGAPHGAAAAWYLFSKHRGRLGFAMVSVAAGLTLGWMVGQDQLIGWARNGVDFSHGLPLVLLTAVALLVPAFTGKNIYCSRICPHGAAQTLVGMAVKRRFALPGRVHRTLQRLPWLTLLAIWVLALIGSGFPLATLEPFEVWSVGFYAVLPAAILTIGLIAAVFLPQGYCHYGCPTGALLKFLTHSPGNFTRKDLVAALLIAAAWIYTLVT